MPITNVIVSYRRKQNVGDYSDVEHKVELHGAHDAETDGPVESFIDDMAYRVVEAVDTAVFDTARGVPGPKGARGATRTPVEVTKAPAESVDDALDGLDDEGDAGSGDGKAKAAASKPKETKAATSKSKAAASKPKATKATKATKAAASKEDADDPLAGLDDEEDADEGGSQDAEPGPEDADDALAGIEGETDAPAADSKEPTPAEKRKDLTALMANAIRGNVLSGKEVKAIFANPEYGGAQISRDVPDDKLDAVIGAIRAAISAKGKKG